VTPTLPSVEVRPDPPALPRLVEAWKYRELLMFLAWRDVTVRYKQTALGVLWAILQPVLTMAIFALIFGRLAGVPTDGVPYPLFAFCGLLPWQLFSFALGASANSLVVNERLVTKVYFPRIVLPLASVVAGLVDFALAFVFLVGLMYYYGVTLTAAILTLPLFVLMTMVAATSVGILLSAVNVQFRDVKHALPFLTQIWMLVTPIAYPTSLFPERWRPLFALNPMVGVVEGFRWCLLGRTEWPGAVLLISGVILLLGTVLSISYFLRVERSFADVI
jgi:lipopolysaccharide transport system permease protein